MDKKEKLSKIETTLETVNELMNNMRIERSNIMEELVDCDEHMWEPMYEYKDKLDKDITSLLNVIKLFRFEEKRLR